MEFSLGEGHLFSASEEVLIVVATCSACICTPGKISFAYRDVEQEQRIIAAVKEILGLELIE